MVKKYLGLALALSLGLVQQSAQAQTGNPITLEDFAKKPYKTYITNIDKVSANKKLFYQISDTTINGYIYGSKSDMWRHIRLQLAPPSYADCLGFIKKVGAVKLSAKVWVASFKAGAKGDTNAIVFKITKGVPTALKPVTP